MKRTVNSTLNECIDLFPEKARNHPKSSIKRELPLNNDKYFQQFLSDVQSLFMQYDWPGNIRELTIYRKMKNWVSDSV